MARRDVVWRVVSGHVGDGLACLEGFVAGGIGAVTEHLATVENAERSNANEGYRGVVPGAQSAHKSHISNEEAREEMLERMEGWWGGVRGPHVHFVCMYRL